MFAAPTFGTLQVTVPRFSPRTFCEAVEKERITHTLLAPTMLNTLTKFSGAKQFDLRGCLKSPDSVIFHRLCFPIPASKQLGRTLGPRIVSLDLPGLFKHPLTTLGSSS